MLLGFWQVAQHEIGLADVLMGATMLRIDGEGFLVDRNGGRGVAVLAGGVGQPIVGIRVLAIARDDPLEKADGCGVVLGLDRLDGGGVLGILGLGGLAVANPVASAAAARGDRRRREVHERDREDQETSSERTRHQSVHGKLLFDNVGPG